MVTEEQHAAFLERFQRARVEAGLPATIDDEPTLRVVAAVIGSNRRRRLEAESAADVS